MGRTLDEVVASLPPARREKIKARVAEIVAEEKSPVRAAEPEAIVARPAPKRRARAAAARRKA